MNCLTAALDYASRGFPVIPVHSINEDGYCSCGTLSDYQGIDNRHAMGKHPYTEHGHKDASKEHSQIYLWWQMWPEANVAIRTGETSKLIVLDVDAKNNGLSSLSQIERQFGALPITPRVRSGGGGLHIYFKHPGFEVRGRRGMRPGIDVMADGGRIVAPPSRHKSGNRYLWIEGLSLNDVSPAALPKWLLKMIQTPNLPKKNFRRVISELWG